VTTGAIVRKNTIKTEPTIVGMADRGYALSAFRHQSPEDDGEMDDACSDQRAETVAPDELLPLPRRWSKPTSRSLSPTSRGRGDVRAHHQLRGSSRSRP
jgi:hypothetical protein